MHKQKLATMTYVGGEWVPFFSAGSPPPGEHRIPFVSLSLRADVLGFTIDRDALSLAITDRGLAADLIALLRSHRVLVK